MHQLQYLVGQKHRNQPYEQVYADQGYVRRVKAHVKEAKATMEQLQFLHYIQLRESETPAAAEPAPPEDSAAVEESGGEDEYDLVEEEAEALSEAATVEQLADRLGHVERVLESLRISIS